MRQIGRQSSAIEKGAVGASQVFNEVDSTFLPDLAMATRNASLKAGIWRKVNIWKDSVSGVETAYVNLFRKR
jgi:hypothetical protein